MIQQIVYNFHTVASKYEYIKLLFVGDTQIQNLCEKITFFAITEIKYSQRLASISRAAQLFIKQHFQKVQSLLRSQIFTSGLFYKIR
jgi:hypothetical protein